MIHSTSSRSATMLAPPAAAHAAGSSREDIISFGPFRLEPIARSLERNGESLEIGSRALDILMVLVERAGEVVSHRELMAKVWRGLVVEPCNLRVNVNLLRKALGECGSYIHNVPRQGYSFVAPIVRTSNSKQWAAVPASAGASAQRHLLPSMLSRMIGREETVQTIARDLLAHRFITLMGPGGMGKTTTALAVGHLLKRRFADAVCFIDLGVADVQTSIAETIAEALGLATPAFDVLPALIDHLRQARVLLILDNCEHLIANVASLAEVIYREAIDAHILATSREALRVEGERALYLPPLSAPSPDEVLRAEEAMKYPAVKLFVERATATGDCFELSDDNVSLVAWICHRLDGIPLAIEFAACRAAKNGISDTARLLDSCLGLRWQGRRTASPRHQTMHSVLAWSYNLLSAGEQLMLRRLAIFAGAFSLNAAQAVAHGAISNPVKVAAAIEQLVAKSLVHTAVAEDGSTLYRLLETVRVYVRIELEESHSPLFTGADPALG